MIPKEIRALLEKNPYVVVATSTLKGKPNAGPKFLLAYDNESLWLVDYVKTRTWKNINKNPQVSIAIMDPKALTAYQLRGRAYIITKKEDVRNMTEKLHDKTTDLSVQRIIEAVRSGVKSETYEISMPSRVVFIIFKVKHISIISPTGDIRYESMKSMKVVVEKPVLKTVVPMETIPLIVPNLFTQSNHPDAAEKQAIK